MSRSIIKPDYLSIKIELKKSGTMNEILITGTGLFTPPESITNTELVSSFNHYVAEFNATHAQAIANNEIEIKLNLYFYLQMDCFTEAQGI